MDNVLRAIIEKAKAEDWNDSEVASRIGESPQTYYNWKKRGGVPREKWIDVVVALGLDPRRAIPELVPVIEHSAGEAFDSANDLVYVNLIDKVHIAAGSGEVIWDMEERYKARAFEAEWMAQEGLRAERCKIIKVKGDSMEPTINHGDAVMINMAQREVIHGEVFALIGDEGLRVKRLHKRAGAIYMHSDNQMIAGKYPDEPIEDGNYAIVGQVIWRAGKLR